MKKNGKIALLSLAAGTVIALALRIYIIVACTDMKTGFLYHDGTAWCNPAYYGVTLLAVAAAVAAVFYAGKKGFGGAGASDISAGRASALGFLMMVIALCACYEGISEITSPTPSAFMIFSDFAFAAVFAVCACITVYKKAFSPALGFSYSFVGIYCVIRGICCFMERMVIASVPEYMIECLTLTGSAVFFVLLGKFLSGNSDKFTKTALCGWGTGTAVLTLSSALGTMFADVLAPAEIRSRITASKAFAEMFFQENRGEDAYMLAFTPFVNLAMGIFIAAALITLFSAKNTDN